MDRLHELSAVWHPDADGRLLVDRLSQQWALPHALQGRIECAFSLVRGEFGHELEHLLADPAERTGEVLGWYVAGNDSRDRDRQSIFHVDSSKIRFLAGWADEHDRSGQRLTADAERVLLGQVTDSGQQRR